MELLNQGTYGCIYRPGITCNAKHQSPKYTTKIHAKGDTGSNESTIGKLIRTKIPNYQNYFSPVLETCDVNLAKVAKDDIDQCEFIHKDMITGKSMKYESSKLKYIEGVTLDDYLAKHNTPSYAEHLFKSLSTSVKKLASNNIVHFDLKENNVIVKKNGKPIIIDFGISINMNDLDTPLNQLFYAYAPEYAPWSPEIHIISYYVHHPTIKKVTKSKIIEIMEQTAQIPYINVSERYLYWANKLNGKTCAYAMKELLKTYKTWDLYAVATMIAQSMTKHGIEPSPKLLRELSESMDSEAM